MLRSAKTLKGYAVSARDNDIGTVQDFYFEERNWAIRFIVCDTSAQFGRDVLIPSQALEGKPDLCERRLRVNATRETIKNSPPVNAHAPVSRQYQHILDRYYSWHLDSLEELEEPFDPPFLASTLHSATETVGYKLKTREGELATVEDFIVDDDNGTIKYLVLQTGLWLPGKKFLLNNYWVDEINWQEKRVLADIPSDKIRSSPEYDPSAMISPEIERRIQDNFGPPKYSTKKALEDIIRRKAQELYSKRGSAPGNDWADWFEAERLVKEELNRMIQKKAQELCSRRGCQPGNELHDWFEAERLVSYELKHRKNQ